MEGLMFSYYMGSFFALCGGIALGAMATSMFIFRNRPRCGRNVGGEYWCILNKGHEGGCGYFVNEGDEE